jgi:hypothetical protein
MKCVQTAGAQHRLQRGFSLLEVSIGLGATAAVGLLLWGILPRQQQVQDEARLQQQISEVEVAVLGFAQRQFRLPCPASDELGREDCSAGATRGRVPWRDLGLDASAAVMNYGVGASTLMQVTAGFVPNLPPQPAGYAAGGYTPVTLINGLDLCQALRGQIAAGGGASIVGAPYAWAAAHPGRNGLFDGANAAGFDMPGKAQSVTPAYDDAVAAQSPAEVAARLGCVQRVAQAQGVTRAAYASYDLWRLTDEFSQFRAYAHQVRQTNVTYAGVNLAFAVVDIANAVATGLTAFAMTLALSPTTAGVVADIAALTIATGAAIGAAGAAGYSLATSIIAEQKADAQKQAAAQEATFAAGRYLVSYTQAVSVDQKGLRP